MFSSTILSGWSLGMSWAPPCLDQSHTKICCDTVFIQHDQGVGLWLNCFIFFFFFLFFFFFFFGGEGGEGSREK